jgi:hypothetical protein
METRLKAATSSMVGNKIQMQPELPGLSLSAHPELRTVLKFDPSNGTILLSLPKERMGLAGQSIDLGGAVFTEKAELHMTICGFQIGKELKKAALDPQMGPRIASLIARYSEPGTFDIIVNDDLRVLRIAKEIPVSVKGGGTIPSHRESLIQEVSCPQAPQFLAELSAIVGRELALPFPHVTLWTHGDAGGIAIADRKALLELSPQVVSKEQIERNGFYVVDGYRFYLKKVGMADCATIERLAVEPETELHLLRHFKSIPDDYRASLIGKKFQRTYPNVAEITISNEMIDDALATIGSKFLPGGEHTATPRELITLVRDQALERCASEQGLPLFDGRFCQKALFMIALPETVGTSSLVPVESGVSYQYAARGKLNGDDFLVNVLQGGVGTPTNTISVVIGVINGMPSIFTAYPGELAPAFPNDSQAEAERQYAKEFWEKHALIG